MVKLREDTKKAILSPTDASRSEYCWDARMNWAMTGTAILAFEIFIAIYAKDGFTRYYLGDVLAAAMLYAFGRAAFRLPPKILALAVFTLSLVIEIVQYFKVLEILGVQNYALWIIFGGTFDWTDIICYAIGCVLAYVSENFIGSEHAIYNEIRIFRRKRLPKNFNEILQSGNNEKIKAVFEIYDINATDKDGNINAKNKKGETPLRNFMWYVYKNLKPHQKLVIVGKQDYTSREYIKQAGEVVNIDFGIMYNYIYNLLPEKSKIYIWRRFGKRLEYLYVPEYPTDMEKYDPQEYSEFTYNFWMKFLRQKDSVQYKMIHAATNLYRYWDYNGEYGRSWDDEYTDKAAVEIKKYFKLGNRLEELNDDALDKMFYNLRKSWHVEDVGKLRYLFVLWLLKNPEPFFEDEI